MQKSLAAHIVELTELGVLPTIKRQSTSTIFKETPRYTTIDIENLRALIDSFFMKDVPSPTERDRILWHYIAEQLDAMGIMVDGYYRRSVYSNFVTVFTAEVMKRDTVIVNNLTHLTGGCVVTITTRPTFIIIERVQ